MAEEYIRFIMASQQNQRLATPARYNRKRNGSEPCDPCTRKPLLQESSVKSLYLGKTSPENNKIGATVADVHVNAECSLPQMISQLSAGMHMLFPYLIERVDRLESKLGGT